MEIEEGLISFEIWVHNCSDHTKAKSYQGFSVAVPFLAINLYYWRHFLLAGAEIDYVYSNWFEKRLYSSRGCQIDKSIWVRASPFMQTSY